jgi:hypothetical protein
MRKRQPARGGTRAKKIGVVAAITMMVPKTLMPNINTDMNPQGRVLSVAKMSVENLLTIRPRGVVSKKLVTKKAVSN